MKTRMAAIVAGAALAVTGCVARTAVLTELIDARRLAADMHVEFMKAAEASNRAVMSDTDEASKAAAGQATALRNAVSQDTQALRQRVTSLGYHDDERLLETFATAFERYQLLDDQILPLAVENTNLKAQRLSFGPAREAVAAFRSALDSAPQPAASRAIIGILEILAAEAPHIAEAGDDEMTRMEAGMRESETRVRRALAELRPSLSSRQLDAAAAAFDRFMSVHTEILSLSRRNSNVRSLALALGNKQRMTAECEAALQMLEQALAQHDFRATR